MKNNLFLNKPLLNIYEKPTKSSKITSQLIFGESFKVLLKKKNYLKIKTNYDKYTGYIKNSKFLKEYFPNYKVKVLKSRIYKKPKLKAKTKQFLTFSSNVQITKTEGKYGKIGNNKWLITSDLEKYDNNIRNFKRYLNLFINCKYLWGGKSYKGIDCSALIQLYYKFNNVYFPRDTIDQIKEKKGRKLNYLFKRGDLIFWKGHVAVCVDKNNLIHAYGPKKKVLKMNIYKTLSSIKKTAKLNVIKIFSI